MQGSFKILQEYELKRTRIKMYVTEEFHQGDGEAVVAAEGIHRSPCSGGRRGCSAGSRICHQRYQVPSGKIKS